MFSRDALSENQFDLAAAVRSSNLVLDNLDVDPVSDDFIALLDSIGTTDFDTDRRIEL